MPASSTQTRVQLTHSRCQQSTAATALLCRSQQEPRNPQMQSAEATAEPVEGTQSCPGGVRDNRLSGGRTVRNFVRTLPNSAVTRSVAGRCVYVLLVMELPASASPLLLAALLAVLLPLVLRLLSGSSKRRAPTTLQPTAQVRAFTVKEAYTGSARLLWPAPSTVFDPAPHRHQLACRLSSSWCTGRMCRTTRVCFASLCRCVARPQHSRGVSSLQW
jgi:hypothetical protein